MTRFEGWVIGLLFSMVVVIFFAVCAGAVIQLAGWYHYEYRCRDHLVVQAHLFIGSQPIGGWDTASGNPLVPQCSPHHP